MKVWLTVEREKTCTLWRHFSVLLALVLLAAGCSTRPLHIKNVAKSDIDLVADAHLEKMQALMQDLTVKLYKRNPRELHKQPYSVGFRLAQLFGPHRLTRFAELDDKEKPMPSCSVLTTPSRATGSLL